MLGICYGMQLMCQALGGSVQSHPVREFGRAHCSIDTSNPEAADLFAGVPRETASLDEPRRPGRHACPDDFVPLAAHRHLPATPR